MLSLSTGRLRNDEILLRENRTRKSLLPIVHPNIWAMYKKAQGSTWTAEEINFKDDLQHWEKLSEDTKTVVKTVLAFFSGADAIVNDNIRENFATKIDILEIKCFYDFQVHIEDVHNEVYSLMIDNLIIDQEERASVRDVINTFPGVQKLYDWAETWIGINPEDELQNNPILQEYAHSADLDVLEDLAEIWALAKQVVAFACVEGIMFSGAFAIIYWLKEQGVLPGLTFSNELISRDEGLHMRFGCMIYNMIVHKPPKGQVKQIVLEATELSKEMIGSCMKRMTGMNSVDMGHYIEYVGDGMLQQLGLDPHYGAKNPFPFMEKSAFNGLTNFFERRVGEYSMSGFEKGHSEDIELGEDF